MRTLVLLTLLTFAAVGCRSTAPLQSSAPTEPVTVDAQLADWSGKLNDAGGNMTVGVQNDAEYLYVAMSTTDLQKISQIMQLGMILWIDRAGGKEEIFGVRYPIGVTAVGGLDDDPTANRIRIEQSMQEVELMGADGRGFRRRKDSVPGITMHGEAQDRVFTYEAKIPLAANEAVAYAIGTEPGQVIGIGFTTPEMDEGMARRLGTGGLPGGNMSSADGRAQYGRYRNANSGGPAPMKRWLVVTLDEAP